MIIQCPHCNDYVWIDQLNCRIFRHGYFKTSEKATEKAFNQLGEQIPPHSTQTECDAWVKKGLVYGCTKPFQILETGEVVRCDYI